MTIWYDEPMNFNPKCKNWSHLTSSTDDPEELHAFAAKIGLSRDWFQPRLEAKGVGCHYDISPNFRKKAAKAGAEYKPAMEQADLRIKKLRELRVDPDRQDTDFPLRLFIPDTGVKIWAKPSFVEKIPVPEDGL
jgi:hypothetical protein